MKEPEVNYLLTLRKRMKKDSKLPYAGDVNSMSRPPSFGKRRGDLIFKQIQKIASSRTPRNDILITFETTSDFT